MTVDHPAEGQGQVLDGRGEHNAGRVCKKTFIVAKWNKSMPSGYHDNIYEGLTGDFQYCRSMLWSSDAVGHLADIRPRVLRLNRRDD